MGLASAAVILAALATSGTTRSDSTVVPSPPSASTAIPSPPSDSPDRDCAGVFYPIELTIEPHEAATPGGVATATVRVSVDQAMGAVELECVPAPELAWLSPPLTLSIERLVPGETLERELAVRLPASLDRQVIEVTVRGWMGGSPMARSAIWSLSPGGEEPSREVARQDGSRVREVAARRIR
jgi:hypothetical protein